MYLFSISSVPIDLVGDIDRFEEQLGGFFYGREFPMRLIASSTRFPMHAPIAAVRTQHHDTERLYLRTRRLRAAIDAWSPDDPTDLLVVALADLDPDLFIDLLVQLTPDGVDLPACRDGRATPEQWESFVAALDRLFWRVPWAREAVRMYETMEQRVLRAVQYTLLTWEPADVAEAAIRIPLAAVTRRPVTRIDALTPVISGPYREHLTYLEPDDPGQPVLAVLTSYDFTGEWNATLFHELISLNMDITIAVDVTTLNRTKSQRVAEMAYNAAKLVARDANLVDIRGEQVVHDARDVLAQLKGQTLHAIQVAILVRGRDKRELDANVITVRDLFGPRLKLMRPTGAQGVALKIFSTLPRTQLEAPWKPRTQLSKVVGCAAGMVGFHRPNATQGIFVGIDRTGRFPIFINLFARNQAAHMIIAGASGYGKTVLLNLLAERAASIGGMQVIGIDAFANGLRVERAIQDCTCYKVGLEHTVNILDVIFGWETEGGWENNQILHVVAQVVMLLGEPGESSDGKKRFIPMKLESGERGVLALAVKRLYQQYGVTPDTPVAAMPTLTGLIYVLEAMGDPVADTFARRLRYLIYGSSTEQGEKTPDGVAFDGCTTIDWRFEDTIVYYDFKTVPEILLPFFYLQALAAVWRYVRTRQVTRDIFLMIDEFGYASQVEAVANAAWVIAKTARKYRLGMVLVDQTMRPFLDTPTGRQLHANAAAHFFFHMQDVEAQDVARAMSVITPRALQFVIDAEPGQCLGVIRKDAYEINVECHPLEASAFLNS
ncbi:MAG: hypothetical protein WCI67_18850 [Chloroflexales bacterium]